MPAPFYAGTYKLGTSPLTYSNTGTVNVPWPDHCQGDLALLVVVDQAGVISTPSGWTAHTSEKTGTINVVGSVGVALFSRACTDSNMPTPAVTSTASYVSGQIFIVRDAGSVAQYATKINAAGSATATFNAITTTDEECLVFGFVATGTEAGGSDTTNATWNDYTHVDLRDFREIADAADGTYDLGLAGIAARRAGTGSTNLTSVEMDETGAHVTLLFSVSPASASAPLAPRFRQKTSFYGAPSGYSHAWPPSHEVTPGGYQPGDLAVLVVQVTGGVLPSLSGYGWTTIAESWGGGNTFGVYYQFATSTGMGAPPLGISSGYIAAQMFTFRGVDPLAPKNVHGGQASNYVVAGNSFSVPDITTTVGNCTIVTVVAHDNAVSLDRDNLSNPSSTTQTNILELHDEANSGGSQPTNGGYGGFSVFCGAQAAAGTVDGLTLTVDQSAYYPVLSFALAPDPKSAPTLCGIGPIVTGQNGDTLAVRWPEHKSGDFALLALTYQSSGPPTTPSGWTYIGGGWAINAGLPYQNSFTALYHRTATSSAMADPSWTLGVPYAMAQMFTYERVSAAAPINASQGGYGGGTALYLPNLTTTVAKCAIATAIGVPKYLGADTFYNWEAYEGASILQLYELQDYADYNLGLGMFTARRINSGSGGGLYTSLGQSGLNWPYIEVALAPAEDTLGGGLTASVTASATLSLPIHLATSRTATATITTADLRVIETIPITVYANLAGTPTLAATTNPPLTTQITPATAVTALATAAAALVAGTHWRTSVAAAATVQGDLTSALRLAASASLGSVTIVAPLTTAITLAASVAVAAGIEAWDDLLTEIRMAASLTASAVVDVALLQVASGFVAMAEASAAATGALTTSVSLAGSATITATVSAPISVDTTMAASLAPTVTAVGDLLTAINPAASVTAAVTVTPALGTAVTAAAALAATTTTTAALLTSKPLFGSVSTNVTILPVALNSSVLLAGNAYMLATAVGAMAGALETGLADPDTDAVVRVPREGWLIHVPPLAGVLPAPRTSAAQLIA